MSAEEQQILKEAILMLWNERRNALEPAKGLPASSKDVMEDARSPIESRINPECLSTQTSERIVPSPKICRAVLNNVS